MSTGYQLTFIANQQLIHIRKTRGLHAQVTELTQSTKWSLKLAKFSLQRTFECGGDQVEPTTEFVTESYPSTVEPRLTDTPEMRTSTIIRTLRSVPIVTP